MHINKEFYNYKENWNEMKKTQKFFDNIKRYKLSTNKI